jgi:hypothetical protein
MEQQGSIGTVRNALNTSIKSISPLRISIDFNNHFDLFREQRVGQDNFSAWHPASVDFASAVVSTLPLAA